MHSIPQTDPSANYLSRKKAIDAAIRRVLTNGRYILGPEVELFEQEFCGFLGAGFAVGVANGTDALELALRACGIMAGDGVATVSHTAVATVSAIQRIGACPYFVDIDPETCTLSPDSLRGLLKRNRKIRAVVPVHLYGHPADMPAVVTIARKHGLAVIEDCAQAHGAAINGRKVGTWGEAAAFSFYPTKNLGALGDGGMVVTNSKVLGTKVRHLREYGWEQRYVSSSVGFNSRLDELQAAVLRVKLKHLNADNNKRRALARFYNEHLSGLEGLDLPHVDPKVHHVFHQYVIRSPQRDLLREKLKKKGIQTLIHYPFAVHQQPAYRRTGILVPLNSTESVCREILSLPAFPELTSSQLKKTVHEIRGVLKG